ncbi:MAG: HEPN domain-containing protein [Candidatus Calescibacterium sp.]|nr:HEPN domain-containing protein [Candidatus Calescibacterium sp.]
MQFDWKYFLQVAKELIQKADSQDKGTNDNIIQAYLRTSISRTYYAIFNIVKEIYENRIAKLKCRKSNVHMILIHSLTESNEDFERKVGELLNNIRKMRNISDYCKENSEIPTIKLLKRQAQRCIDNSILIMQELERLR